MYTGRKQNKHKFIKSKNFIQRIIFVDFMIVESMTITFTLTVKKKVLFVGMMRMGYFS